MAKNVFILGAGASQMAGAPLMNNFLDKAEEIFWDYKNRTFGLFDDKDSNDFAKVFELISKLQIVHSKSYLDLYNIESLFSALEMANLLNRLIEYKPDEIKALRGSLTNLIVKTLELSIEFPNDGIHLTSPEPYDKFVELIKGLGDSSVVTFNYDHSLDYAIFLNDIKINYCIDNNQDTNYRLLKLHGSTSWGRCQNPGCNKILPYNFHRYFNAREGYKNHLSLQNEIGLLKHEEDRFQANCKDRVIIPPTWNKTQYHGDLANVWENAAKELSEATNIFVIGYSLPETDSFFRYLFALGSISDTRIKRFWVFDPDGSGEVKKRYEKLIGKGIERRFCYKPDVFDVAIEIIAKEMGVKVQAKWIT